MSDVTKEMAAIPYDRPKEPLVIPGFTIAGRCYPAEFAAGDHFEFLRSPDGPLFVVLGDVCGHGVGPAILNAAFHAQLRALSTDLSEPEEIAAKVNAALHEDTATGMFLTLIVARLDPDSRVLNYVNAGHLPGIVLDSEGQVKARLEGSNFPAGIVPGVTFHKGPPVQLKDGDLVLLFTDGLVEAQTEGRPEFGVQRTIQAVRNHRHQSPTEVIDALHGSLYAIRQTQRLANGPRWSRLPLVRTVAASVSPILQRSAHGPIALDSGRVRPFYKNLSPADGRNRQVREPGNQNALAICSADSALSAVRASQTAARSAYSAVFGSVYTPGHDSMS